MKKLIALSLSLFCVLLMGSVAFGWSSAISGKTMVGINYLTWGTYTDLSTEAVSITTGLSTVRAFGTNVNTGETFVTGYNSTVESDAIYAKAIAGVIKIKANNNDVKDGTWWAIGR